MIGFSTDIEHAAEHNDAFRKVLYTGVHSQLVVMTLNWARKLAWRDMTQSISSSASNRVRHWRFSTASVTIWKRIGRSSFPPMSRTT